MNYIQNTNHLRGEVIPAPTGALYDLLYYLYENGVKPYAQVHYTEEHEDNVFVGITDEQSPRVAKLCEALAEYTTDHPALTEFVKRVADFSRRGGWRADWDFRLIEPWMHKRKSIVYYQFGVRSVRGRKQLRGIA